MLNDIELKLLRLALDRAAPDGEYSNAAIMLIRKLRERNATADDLFVQSNRLVEYETAFNHKGYADDFIMPLGKHKGELLEDIPVSYLRWALNNCNNIKPNLRNAIKNIIYEN